MRLGFTPKLTLVEVVKRWSEGDLVWRIAIALTLGYRITFDATSADGARVQAVAHPKGDVFAVSWSGNQARFEHYAADLAVYVAQLNSGRPLPSPMQDMLWRTSVRREQAIAKAQWT